ncbi:hypothetical protein ABZ864_09640 [Streptomyces sp. NPDC047082]|uniref:hypothetical protein n=1 Tax=Streptomyces sp. NPDC047082 TaxID=3155259 RepID=UPI00340C2166
MANDIRITGLTGDVCDESAERRGPVGQGLLCPLGRLVTDLPDLQPGGPVLDIRCGACLLPVVGADMVLFLLPLPQQAQSCVESLWNAVLGLGDPPVDERAAAAAFRAAGLRHVESRQVSARSRFGTIDGCLSWAWAVMAHMQGDLVPPEVAAESTAEAREALKALADADGSLEFSCPARTVLAVR